jgi:hypothetical protein
MEDQRVKLGKEKRKGDERGMMSNPLNLLLCLLLHLSYEIRTSGVVTTCEEEVLPH